MLEFPKCPSPFFSYNTAISGERDKACSTKNWFYCTIILKNNGERQFIAEVKTHPNVSIGNNT
jgi:hypothetical protein